MDDRRLERIEAKMDDIADHTASIDITLAKQSIILAEHIRRTEILEEKLEPVETHVKLVNAILKLSGVGGLGHAIMHYIIKIY